MHVSTTAPPRGCSKIETYAAEVEEIFAGRRAMRPNEIKAAIMTNLATSSRTADRRLATYRRLGLIRRDVANLWVLATSVQSPLSPLSPTPIYTDGDGENSPMTASPPSPTPIYGVGDGGDGRGEDSQTGGIVTRAFGCGRSWHGRQNDRTETTAHENDENAAYGRFFGKEAYLPHWPFFTDCAPQFRKSRMRWYWRQATWLQALRKHARTQDVPSPATQSGQPG